MKSLGSAPGTDAEDQAAARQVVEEGDALGHLERVVVRQVDDGGAEADARGALRRGGDHQVGRGDGLPAAAVVLADQHLVEADALRVLDELQVALERERGVLPRRVRGHHEHAELQGRSSIDGAGYLNASVLESVGGIATKARARSRATRMPNSQGRSRLCR